VRYVRALGIQAGDLNRSAEQVRDDAAAPLRLLLDRAAAVRRQCDCRLLGLERFNSLDVLAALAFSLQQRPDSQPVPRGEQLLSHFSLVGDRLALLLAASPVGIFTARQLDLDFRAVTPIEHSVPWLALTMLPRQRPADDEIVKALVFDQPGLQQQVTGPDGLAGRPFPGTRNQGVVITPEQAGTFLEFFSHTLAKLHNSPQVREARMLVVLIQGLEQWMLLWVGFYLLAVLAGRSAERRRQQRQLEALEPLVKEAVLDDMREQRTALPPGGAVGARRYEAALGGTSGLIKRAREILENERLVPPNRSVDDLRRRSMAFFVMTAAAALQKRGEAGSSARDLRDVCDREALALSLSRTILSWGGRSLVGIGFLGTVRGIMMALSGADVIVLAASRIQQAAAIGEVASTLGLAFATTLVALAINLVLSLILSLQAAEEVRLVVRVERVCIPLLQPGLSDPSDGLEDVATDAEPGTSGKPIATAGDSGQPVAAGGGSGA
jgi:hypothetical protein